MAQLGVLRRWLGLGLAAALTPVGLAGQTAAPGAPPTRQTVVAGAHYRAGWLHRLFLGAHYRDLWGTPVEVELLDLSRFAGGLTPTGCRGRRRTEALGRSGPPAPRSCSSLSSTAHAIGSTPGRTSRPG